MKIINAKKFLACLMAVLVLLTSLSVGMASAETSGDFEYVISIDYNGDEEIERAIITGYTGNEADLTIPDTIDGYPVVGIGYGAFSDCDVLTSVTVPESVTCIEGWAFEECDNLTEINLPDTLEELGSSILYDSGYYNDEGNWENDILYLDEFLVDTKFTIEGDVEVKEGTRIIADQAFFDSEITSVKLPSSLKIIGSSAFEECFSITEIEIPNGVEVIGNYAFEKCINLTSITMPNSVTELNYNIVSECVSLKEFTIPETVKVINFGAFEGSGIEKIHIPASVEELYSDAFSNCTSLAEVTVDSENPVYYSVDGVLYEKSNLDFMGDLLVYYPAAKEGEVYNLPAEVEQIDCFAFSYCQNLKAINIHETASYILIYDALSVEEINVSEENTFFKSTDGITFNKEGDTLFCYPSDKKGESYTTGEGVAYVISDSFTHNSNIKEITFSEGVEEISSYAIYDCENLEKINLPSTLVELDSNYVSECSNLTAIYFNGTMEEYNAFDAEIDADGSKGLYVYCTDGKIELVAPYDERTDPTEGDTGTTPPEFPDPTETTPTGTTSTDPTESTPAENTATDPTEGDTGTTPPTELAYDLGDSNMDGKLNIRDATAIQKHLAKITTLDETALMLADFNADNKVNVKDATAIQKHIAGIR